MKFCVSAPPSASPLPRPRLLKADLRRVYNRGEGGSGNPVGFHNDPVKSQLVSILVFTAALNLISMKSQLVSVLNPMVFCIRHFLLVFNSCTIEREGLESVTVLSPLLWTVHLKKKSGEA